MVRTVGISLLTIGGVLVTVGLSDFFMSFGGRTPKLFWCAFVGAPLLGLGASLTRAGFSGAVLRYFANEALPVGSDAANYLAKQSADALRTTLRTAAVGVADGIASSIKRVRACYKCNADNDDSSRFCCACGASLRKSMSCGSCGELNDPDAKFCDRCGVEIQAT